MPTVWECWGSSLVCMTSIIKLYCTKMLAHKKQWQENICGNLKMLVDKALHWAAEESKRAAFSVKQRRPRNGWGYQCYLQDGIPLIAQTHNTGCRSTWASEQEQWAGVQLDAQALWFSFASSHATWVKPLKYNTGSTQGHSPIRQPVNIVWTAHCNHAKDRIQVMVSKGIAWYPSSPRSSPMVLA